ncbi:hypothetical protein [Gordonia sputi]|uniref:Uncharacterized protein n=1 Tax=Gordonia sputi NBRC 100414 TaxID=1089453 RepID=H5U6B0_9ACTN|nr:hypothetical protein [Gordonia sputi]GAB41268.1 hypothetical protein GOSPT_125_00350 [Gordonia sputi NBRC 100414]
MTAIAAQPPLLEGEVVEYHAQFSPRLLLKHIKTTVTLTNRRVIVHEPHVIFGFIEHGHFLGEIPLRHVSQISTGNTTSSRRIMWGTIAVLVGLFFLMSSGALGLTGVSVLVGLLFIVVGVVFFATAHSNGIVFRSTGGSNLVAHGSKSELPQIEQAGQIAGNLIFS